MICLNCTMDGERLLPQNSPALEISRKVPRQKKLRGIHAWMAASVVLGAAFSLDARADYWFRVSDASQIQYLVTNPQIYLRNLNTFDASVQGTAPWTDYNYWIDVSTDGGKACWATLLAKMEAKEPIWIYITSQTANGAVTIGWFG
jgi:hypothetical protein